MRNGRSPSRRWTLSVEIPEPVPQQSGLTPLSSAPIPLSQAAAWGWALAILFGTLFFGYGVPALASRVAAATVPPGAIAFGSASVIPDPEWSQTSATATSVTLEKGGVWITFTSAPAQGLPALARVQDLSEHMRDTYPQLTVASEPSSFQTATRTDGQLIALAGSSQTAIVAAVVDVGQAVDVQSLGDSTQFGESLDAIEAMIESIRILDPADG
jgi:hypothetical protein